MTAPSDTPRRSRFSRPDDGTIMLMLLLVGTGILYIAALGASGWANEYYSAAAQAGSRNWQAFLFGSSDAANSITIDKPPASIWVMAISIRLFGLNTWSILVPQALMGVGTVLILYLTVKRSYSQTTALAAGTLFAIIPVATLIFRFNNPDALLVLLLVASASLVLRGAQTGKTWPIALAGVAVGFAFLTKELEAFLILPALVAVVLITSPVSIGRRLLQTAVAAAGLVVSAGWWVAIATLTPANARPYIGGSLTNSFLEVTLGYNGIGRLTGSESGVIEVGAVATGPQRLFGVDGGAEFAWLLPAAILAAALALVLLRRAPRTSPRRALLILSLAWLVVGVIVFSSLAGIYHSYYLVAIAPPEAILVAVGGAELWAARDQRVFRWGAAAAILASGLESWLLWGYAGSTLVPFGWLVIGSAVVAAIAWLVLPAIPARITQSVVLILAFYAVALGPLGFSILTAATPHTGSFLSAGPLEVPGEARPVGPGRNRPVATSSRLVELLAKGSTHYRWEAATVGGDPAAVIQLETQQPVMSVGGFAGADPSPTLARFKELVAGHQIHWFIDSSLTRQNSPTADSNQIGRWVSGNFVAQVVDGVTIYDLSR